MEHLNFSWQHIHDGSGWAIAMVGMSIVFVGLMSISIYIAVLPRILGLFSREKKAAVKTTPAKTPHIPTDGMTVAQQAAVAYVIHMEKERLLDEGTKVTIPIYGDAFSPWALSDKMRTFPTKVS